MKRNYKTLPMEGRIFGKWTVIKKAYSDKHGCHFECMCECGVIKIIQATTLRAGKSKQCKDCHYKSQYSPDLMVGRMFGKWKVMEFVDVRCKLMRFKCVCKCGNTNILYGADLRAKKTTMCHICHNRENAKKNIKHGYYDTSTYRIWRQMLQRCNNPNTRFYARYGGRRISVCERWIDFNNFLKDMGLRPEGLTIDRINNDGNYEPSNCRWVTHKENCNNRSNKKKI